jgi:hypothetical protein
MEGLILKTFTLILKQPAGELLKALAGCAKVFHLGVCAILIQAKIGAPVHSLRPRGERLHQIRAAT